MITDAQVEAAREIYPGLPSKTIRAMLEAGSSGVMMTSRAEALVEAAYALGYRAGQVAMRERAAEAVEIKGVEIGSQQCCGHAVGGYTSPPECCGNPDLILPAHEAADAILALPIKDPGA